MELLLPFLSIGILGVAMYTGTEKELKTLGTAFSLWRWWLSNQKVDKDARTHCVVHGDEDGECGVVKNALKWELNRVTHNNRDAQVGDGVEQPARRGRVARRVQTEM